MDRRAVQFARIVAIASIVMLANVAAHSAAEKMVLSRHLKAGAVTTYTGTIKTNLQGMEIELSLSQKQTIKTVKENGTFVVYTEDQGGTLKVDGKEEQQAPALPSTETRDKLGKLVDFAQELAPNPIYTPEIHKLMMAIRELVLSDKVVSEGDTWDTVLENPASSDNKVKVKTTYQGIEKVDGIDLWKFKQAAEAVVNADGSKMSIESIILVNPKDGLTEKIDGKIKDVPTIAGPIDISMVIQRSKSADGAKVAK